MILISAATSRGHMPFMIKHLPFQELSAVGAG